MTATDAAMAKLDMGRVFTDTFGAIRQSWLVLGGFGLITLIPAALNSMLVVKDPAMASGIVFTPGYWIALIGGLIVGALIYAAQLYTAVSTLQGRPPGFAEAAKGALPKILPMIALWIVSSIAIGLAFLLLIVPGFILMVMWAVALPALATESGGPIKALARSRALTRGNRWRVFGVYLVLMIFVIVLDLLMVAVTQPALIGAASASGAPLPVTTIVVSALIGLVFSVFLTTFVSAIYVQLRQLKDGVGGANLAEVFD